MRRVLIGGDMLLGLLRAGHFECMADPGQEVLPDDTRILDVWWDGQAITVFIDSASFTAEMSDIELLYRVKSQAK